MRSRLRDKLSTALTFSAKSGLHQVVLELFSGKGVFAAEAQRHHFGTVCVDILDGIDFTNKRVKQLIRGWITSRVVVCVWLGTPCSSWSRARRDYGGAGPRDMQHIYGKAELWPLDAARIKLGNETMQVSCFFIH